MRACVPLDIDIDHVRRLVHTKADGTIVLQEILAEKIGLVGPDDERDRFANLGGAKRPLRIFRDAEEGRRWLATALQA
jgi:hypothetical protein